jgi:hypothetical protein
MEPVIEQWGRENYPRLMENEKLIEALYKRKVLNKPTLVSQIMAYPLKKVVNLVPDEAASVIVTKVESTVTERSVCKVCNRSNKNCAKAQQEGSKHTFEATPFYVVNMLAGDETGMQKFQRLGTDRDSVDAIEHGEVFVLTGSLKKSTNERWGDEFDIRSFAVLSTEQKEAWDSLDDYNSIHGGEGGLSEDEFNKFVDGKQELMAPIFERVYVSHLDGRVRF